MVTRLRARATDAGNTLFFLLLLSLIVTLYERYRSTGRILRPRELLRPAAE